MISETPGRDRASLPNEEPTGGRRRRRLSPEGRRNEILDGAARSILEDGLSSFALERLARELGISKALVYGYFRSRDDLLAALLQREQADLRNRGMRAAMDANTFEALIRNTTRLYLEQSRDHGPLIEALLADPSVARLMETENRAERDRTVRFFVRAGRRRYGLPLSTAVAAVQLLMAVTGEAGKLVSDGTLEVAVAEDLCLDLITGGLAKVADRARRELRAAQPPDRVSPSRRPLS